MNRANAIGISPFVSTMSNLLSTVSIAASDEMPAVEPSLHSISACVYDEVHKTADVLSLLEGSTAEGCYPLSTAFVLYARRRFSGVECAQLASGEPSFAYQVAQTVGWLLDNETAAALRTQFTLPLSTLNHTLTQQLLHAMECDGFSLFDCPVGSVRLGAEGSECVPCPPGKVARNGNECVEEPNDNYGEFAILVLATTSGTLLLFACGLGSRKLFRMYRKVMHAAHRDRKQQRERTHKALKMSSQAGLARPCCCSRETCPFSFLAARVLITSYIYFHLEAENVRFVHSATQPFSMRDAVPRRAHG
eukprot:6204904-Pleurochrysis_carterae.AAC.1